jgi:microcystin-dependent protein
MPYLPSMPPPVPQELQELSDWFQNELETISRSLVDQQEVELRVRNAAPEKPRAGMQAYADGTNWDPGEGAGLYSFDGTNWVKSTVAGDLGGLATLNEVALSNIEDIVADRLLGREGTVGVPEVLTLGTGLAFSGKSVVCTVSGGDPIPTGARIGFTGLTAPSGWVLADGRTIGDVSSGATNRANDDTEALFTLLWNSYASAELAIETAVGASTTRGASAAADFAAHKRLALPDYSGRVGVGKDDMSGSAAGRITSGSKAGIDGTTMGTSGGVEEYQLTEDEMPSHIHDTLFALSGGSVANTQPNGLGRAATYDTLSAGGDEAHTNVQPSIIETVLIKIVG